MSSVSQSVSQSAAALYWARVRVLHRTSNDNNYIFYAWRARDRPPALHQTHSHHDTTVYIIIIIIIKPVHSPPRFIGSARRLYVLYTTYILYSNNVNYY